MICNLNQLNMPIKPVNDNMTANEAMLLKKAEIDFLNLEIERLLTTAALSEDPDLVEAMATEIGYKMLRIDMLCDPVIQGVYHDV